MPTLQLHLTPAQTAGHHARLAQALTAITARVLGKRPDVTAVLIHERAAAHWFLGGEAAQQPTALLEIDITAGTNTAAEKAAFIAEAFAELQAQLAPGASLAPASYVIVREVPASDWGYAGLTQQARRQAQSPWGANTRSRWPSGSAATKV
jgi:4-oxalocrotonate tautomerase